MGANTEIKPDQNIVLYDGVCNFCNSSVNFIIRHENSTELKFAALQSEFGQQLLQEHGEETQDFNSIVFLSKEGLSKKSTAAFKISRFLKPPWKHLAIFRVLPTPITDFFYGLIANNRYKLFGRSDACMVPSPEIRSRFID